MTTEEKLRQVYTAAERDIDDIEIILRVLDKKRVAMRLCLRL